MEFTFNKTEQRNLIEALQTFTKPIHNVISDNEQELMVDIDNINDIDDLAKKAKEGEYFLCKVTRFGSSEVKQVFFNWLTDEWEHELSYHAEINQLTDEELSEYNSTIIK